MEDAAVNFDPDLLDLVWNNVLSNAVKFTPEGGRIVVSMNIITTEGAEVVVAVKDSGIGMNAETQSRVFEKFYQGDTSHSGEGNGLGLALAKKIVEMAGGGISVESEPGKGSVFTVRLPLA
jgi:signal transduction histidine kinase